MTQQVARSSGFSVGHKTALPLEGGWTAGPHQPRLVPRAVHVWRADLTTVTDDVLRSLSPSECERAARFPHERDGRLWARAHGVLRALLSRYLDIDPSTLRFGAEGQGKPVLLGSATARLLSFNLSHSGRLALYAFAENFSVGVDVQVASRRVDPVAIAARVLGSEEARRLMALAPAIREQEFLRAWARHEAEFKCLGTGLGGGSDARTAAELWIADLNLGVDAAGALAVEVTPLELRCWEWPTQTTAGSVRRRSCARR
jgi:4'-phosphopantetheinyl transferase